MREDVEVSGQEEEILLVVHKHWASLVGQVAYTLVPGFVVLATLFVFQAPTAADSFAHAVVTLLVPLCFLILWTILALQWTDYYLDMLVLSDRRLFYTAQVNFTQRTIEQWNIPDIRAVRVRFGSLFQSFFDYGTIEIESDAGTTYISGIPDPGYVAAVILKQDDRYDQLKDTARKQRELLHFLSHEVKGHLTKSKAAFASILEGDFGAVSAPLHTMAGQALADTQKGVDTVMSILGGDTNADGELHFEKKPFDFTQTILRVVDELKPRAQEKGLTINVSLEPFCALVGDERKIERHVVRNLIENAIRYTPAGHIDVTLRKEARTTRLTIADSGVGITTSDAEKLFTEGGHGEHSKDVNPDSTGYGLFVAKKVVDAHSGNIWARSSGPGSGSQFFAEFPLPAYLDK